MRINKESKVFHSIECAKGHQFPKDQMALFPVVPSEG